MKIEHTSVKNNWNDEDEMNNAAILILGSFNPFNTNNDNADYYYGRCTNYFWKSIADLQGKNPNYYFNNFSQKSVAMKSFKFCFLDIINSIEITCTRNDENTISNFEKKRIITEFVGKKIFTEFSDTVLFTTNTKFNNNFKIHIEREYNQKIIRVLNNGKIKKVIHTLGNVTINKEFITKWQEGGATNKKGFQGFINKIHHSNITFVKTSFSPSGRAVKVGGDPYYLQLKNWLDENLQIKK